MKREITDTDSRVTNLCGQPMIGQYLDGFFAFREAKWLSTKST